MPPALSKACIDVVCAAGVVRGQLVTGQHRVSDVLNQPDQEYITIEDASIVPLRGGAPIAQHAPVLLHKTHIHFVIDRTVREATLVLGKRAPRTTVPTTVLVGSYILRGTMHVPPRAQLDTYLMLSSGRFFPVTDVTIGERTDQVIPTVLVNRDHCAGLTV